MTAAGLGGYLVGKEYAVKLDCVHVYDSEIWPKAEKYYNFVKSKQQIPFTELLNHLKKIKAHPFC